MDALSSSFLSAIPREKILISTTTTKSHSPLLRIYSIKTEDRPTSSTVGSPPPPTTTNGKFPFTTTTTTPPKKRGSNSPPPHQQSDPWLPTTILNTLDTIVNTFIDPPILPSIDPKFVLSNNFAPVNELPPTPCQLISGKIPPSLDGAYMRNGPNPQFLPRGPYHLFDGDGMVHCLHITNGGTSVTLSSRYIRTHKYTVERTAGTSVLPNVFSGFNGLTALAARGALIAARVAAGQFNPLNGGGLANTNLAIIGHRLYALGESDLPYEIKLTPNGDIITLNRQDFNGKLYMSMTAHPKTDPETGETFAFRYGPIPPFLTYFRFDRDGNKHTADIPIFSMTRPSFLHDFAITKKYAIFPDIQLGMDAAELVIRGGPPVGADPGKVPRLGVIPRYANDERSMKWFDVPGFNVMHAINAWDEVDEYGNEILTLIAPNILSIEHTLKNLELVHACVERVKIDLTNGTVSRTPLSASNLDFAVLNPAYVGKKNRYVYAAIGDPMPKISGVVKLDLEVEGKGESVVARRMFGKDCFGGEPFFVAKEPDNNNTADEDDGYLVSYVHDEKKGVSSFIVMDAKSPELEVVAEVALPGRVPYGFHGLFVRDKDLIKS